MTPQEIRFLRRLEQRADRLAPLLRAALLQAFRLLRDTLSPAELARLIERGDVDAVLRLTLADAIVQRAFYPVRAAIRQGTLDNARAALKYVPVRPERLIGIVFDPELDPRVREAIRTLETGAIPYTAGDAREAFRRHILDGLERGVNPRAIAGGLRDVLGLTARQERAIGNFQKALAEGDYAKALTYELRDKRFDPTLRRLLREGKVLTDKQLLDYGAAYRRKFVARNAETMARTAALESQRVGQQLAWAEAKASGALGDANVIKIWVATLDARVGEDHEVMHHAEAPLDGAYRTGERYPGQIRPWNCRCTEVYRVVR